jgi:hypothetical protein
MAKRATRPVLADNSGVTEVTNSTENMFDYRHINQHPSGVRKPQNESASQQQHNQNPTRSNNQNKFPFLFAVGGLTGIAFANGGLVLLYMINIKTKIILLLLNHSIISPQHLVHTATPPSHSSRTSRILSFSSPFCPVHTSTDVCVVRILDSACTAMRRGVRAAIHQYRTPDQGGKASSG